MPKIPWPRFRAEVLSFYEPPERRKTTYWKIRQVLGLIDGLGVRTTADLIPPLIVRFKAIDPDWKPATVNGYLGYLRAICSYAVVRKYIALNPFEARKDWRVKERRSLRPGATEDHLTMEQVAALLEAAGTTASSWRGGRIHAVTSLVAYTGLRKMEALTRRVEDFDLPRRILYLEPNRFWEPKTTESVQPIPLPAALVPVLATWFRRGGSEWAFPATRGRVPWTSGGIGQRPLDVLQAIGQSAGVPHVTFQLLRHSWATHAEHWGLGELMVQRVLRHTTTRTQKHYRHADLINLAAAVKDIRFGPAVRSG